MSARSIQARLAAETRHRPDEDHTELRRQLKAEQLADYIRRTVDAAPPLNPEQRDKLALLLRGGDRGGRRAS
jgi:type II secretory pathway predicted ATPase ExeA